MTNNDISVGVKLGIKRNDVITAAYNYQEFDEHTDDRSNVEWLAALGTWVNLFIIVGCDGDDEYASMFKKIRYYGLSEEVVPDHRIIRASTGVGRIAVVRHMKPAVHFDFALDVKVELKRFKFRVYVYGGEAMSEQAVVSAGVNADKVAEHDRAVKNLADFTPEQKAEVVVVAAGEVVAVTEEEPVVATNSNNNNN